MFPGQKARKQHNCMRYLPIWDDHWLRTIHHQFPAKSVNAFVTNFSLLHKYWLFFTPSTLQPTALRFCFWFQIGWQQNMSDVRIITMKSLGLSQFTTVWGFSVLYTSHFWGIHISWQSKFCRLSEAESKVSSAWADVMQLERWLCCAEGDQKSIKADSNYTFLFFLYSGNVLLSLSHSI